MPARDEKPEEHYAHYYRGSPPPAPTARYAEWLRRAETGRGPGRMLEVGAGSGGLVRVARERGWRVDATEISESALPALRATGAEVFAGDVQHAAYPEGSFDLVVAIEVIEHVPAPRAILAELYRITAPAGRVLLTTPNFGGVSRRSFGLRWRAVEAEHLSYFTPASLRRMLKEVGYRSVGVRSRSLDVSMWRRQVTSAGPVAGFDAHGTAQLRDQIEASGSLRLLREGLNLALAATGLGDSLVAWARK